MKQIKKILFVCTGNSCRSIMAEAYMRKRAKEEGLCLEVRSAGTLGIDGAPPTKEALMLIRNEGISDEGYVSTPLTEQEIDWADIILVMEPNHKDSIIRMVPSAAEKTAYLGSFNKEAGDIIIPDPIGRPLAFYRVSFRLITGAIEGVLEWLKK